MKVLSIIKYLFSAVGLALLLGALVSYQHSSDFLDSALSTQGTVVGMEKSRGADSTSYFPIIEYVTNEGQKLQFRSSTGSSRPAYSIGETVEVLYSPQQTEDARLNSYFSLWGAALILAILGAVFLFVGVIIMLVGVLKNRKKAYLQRNGSEVIAQFQSVEFNHQLEVNGRNPFVIVCQWLNPVTREVHVFESENIWFDPSPYIQGETVKVLIERDNPKKYYVDVSFLPKVAR